MKKKLSEMSLEELQELFPIFFNKTSNLLEKLVFRGIDFFEKHNSSDKKISHIVSTAIPNIWAKPIIDILIEVPNNKELSTYVDLIVNSGYICMSQNKNNTSFNKGYTVDGFTKKRFIYI